jgi:hypothetical protein
VTLKRRRRHAQRSVTRALIPLGKCHCGAPT